MGGTHCWHWKVIQLKSILVSRGAKRESCRNSQVISAESNNGRRQNCRCIILPLCISRYCQCAWRRRTSSPTSPTCSRTLTWPCAWPSATTSPALRSCSPASSTRCLQQGITPRPPRWRPTLPRYLPGGTLLTARVKQRDATRRSTPT